MSQAELKKLPSLRISQIRESRDLAISLIRLFSQCFTIGTAIAIAESVTPPTGYSGGKPFEDRENVQELSYGTDNRMAKSVFVGQVYTNAGANHQQ
jgi:hypothetical protein